jgi:DNA repair protein RadC
MPAKTVLSPDQSSETPHHHGHRERFYAAGPEALSDYELLEMAQKGRAHEQAVRSSQSFCPL